jgi:putative membrane protein
VNIVAQLLVIIAVLFHVFAFVMESLLFSRPAVRALFGVRPESAEGVRPWALNQGFYNLLLAAGPVAGLIAYHSEQTDAGRALVIYGCAFMSVCGLVLLATDRRMWRGAVGQSGPPLLALIALIL